MALTEEDLTDKPRSKTVQYLTCHLCKGEGIIPTGIAAYPGGRCGFKTCQVCDGQRYIRVEN